MPCWAFALRLSRYKPFARREKGLTSEPVLTVVENIHSKLDFMSALMQESLLWTRAASTINVDDLCVLRSCFDTAPLPEEEVPLSSLLGAETEGGESFWYTDIVMYSMIFSAQVG